MRSWWPLLLVTDLVWIPPLVVLGVAGQHSFLALHDEFEDRAADGEALFGAGPFAVLAVGRLDLAGFLVDEHHHAAVGFDPLKDQIEYAGQELVNVKRVTDRQGGAVHHL